jgi:starch synthase (maltosyl-transferring)
VLTIVNLDPFNRQSGWVQINAAALGLGDGPTFTVQDVLSKATYTWNGTGSGSRNFVALDPRLLPAHIFVVRP